MQPRRLRQMFQAALTALVLVLLMPLAAQALDVPPVPKDVPIVDLTKTLTDEQKTTLAGIIAEERAATGNQIAVLMIPSLEDEVIEDYSIKVARGWGIGSEDRNNGVLLLVAKNDRKLRIEVGYGLEGTLTDIRAGQIIRDRISPLFKEGKYFEGLQSGLVGITTAIHNEIDPALSAPPKKGLPNIPFEFLIFALFFIPSWLGSMLARTKSWWAGGIIGAVAGGIIALIFGFMIVGLIALLGLTLVGLLFDRAVSNNFRDRSSQGMAPSWWAGGTHIGGSGSGGFGGFGGGSFGGGGAGGDW